jgi:hypothetical protein
MMPFFQYLNSCSVMSQGDSFQKNQSVQTSGHGSLFSVCVQLHVYTNPLDFNKRGHQKRSPSTGQPVYGPGEKSIPY